MTRLKPRSKQLKNIPSERKIKVMNFSFLPVYLIATVMASSANDGIFNPWN